MATKSTTKSPARKAATTARKPAKTVPQKETPPKAKESKAKAAEKPARATASAKEKVAPARITAAPEKTEEKPKSANKMESVSLIDKPKAKSADGVPKVRTAFLPPISKLVAKPGLTAPPPPPVEPPPPPPAPVAEVAAVSSTDGQAGEVATPVEEEPKNVITIKPPIIVKELATQL